MLWLRLMLLRPVLHLLVRSAALERLSVRLLLAARLVALVVEFVSALHVGTLKRLLLVMRVLLRELRLCRHDHAVVMLGVLEISFRGDRVTGGLGVARELGVFLGDVVGGSPDLHVGAVRFIHPRHRIVAAAIASAHPLIVVLPVSHFIQSLFLRGTAALLTNTRFPHPEAEHRSLLGGRFGRADRIMREAHEGYVRVFTNLETNSALNADFLPLGFAPQPLPRATIGEASDPDRTAGGDLPDLPARLLFAVFAHCCPLAEMRYRIES
jgi:hypothetical protein